LEKRKYKSAYVKEDVFCTVDMAQVFIFGGNPASHSIKLQDCVPSEFEDCEHIPRVTG
jgi:hypothetical protein